MLPPAGGYRRRCTHSNGIAGPDAVQARLKNAPLKHQVKAVVAHIGAECALQNDNGQWIARLVAKPEVDRETVPAVDLQEIRKDSSVIPLEANRLAADAGNTR